MRPLSPINFDAPDMGYQSGGEIMASLLLLVTHILGD